MQQATSSSENLASSSGNFLPAASPQTSFVINLCASTTPVGLVHPSHPQLKRFTFFVSRRREEGRERFRLHMGYFSSQEEAEKLLDAVRDIYPAAWAGVAPGQNLRMRTPVNTTASAPAVFSPGSAPDISRAAAQSAAATATPAAAAPAVASPAATAPAAPAPAVAAPQTETARREITAEHSLTNVRAAIDSLRDQPAAAPAAVAPSNALVAATPVPVKPEAAPAAQPLRDAQVLQLLESAPAQPASAPIASTPVASTRTPMAAPRQAPVPSAAAPTAARSEPRNVAQLRSVPAARAAKPASGGAPRAATTTSPATPAAAATPELAAYAVQLLWSVQPIDMGQVPQLAIFAAYTLYGAEGNRDGRRWYGLRLGFFTDAVSAKQVAQYVRSEFKSVSVVPVTHRERSRASAATAKPLPTTATSKTIGHELNFIEDIPTDTAMSGSRPALQIDAKGNVVRTGGTAPATKEQAIDAIISELANNERAGNTRPTSRSSGGKRAKLRVAQGTKPVSKHTPRHDGPLTLEETLEILGASTLQLDKGRGELLNDASNRERRADGDKSRGGSRFGRLMDRLAERFSGS
jgi:hypothetical protein